MTKPPPDFVFFDLTHHPYRVRMFCGKRWLFSWEKSGSWQPVGKITEAEKLEYFATAIPMEQAKEFEGGLPFLSDPMAPERNM